MQNFEVDVYYQSHVTVIVSADTLEQAMDLADDQAEAVRQSDNDQFWDEIIENLDPLEGKKVGAAVPDAPATKMPHGKGGHLAPEVAGRCPACGFKTAICICVRLD